MRRILSIIFLQAYAVLLAFYQALGSVRTDEAKYLLDIPYPHPPLARFILYILEGWQYQEIFWRIVFATFLVQAVWLLVRLTKNFTPEFRLTLYGMWLLSASVLFQSGTIMMSVLSAVQGMILVYLLLSDVEELNYAMPAGRQELRTKNYACVVAFFWLISLFTAYQAVLYMPIVIAILWRAKMHPLRIAWVIGIPLVLVALYVLQNPLALASFVSAGGQNTALPFAERVQLVGGAWAWSGSIVLSVLGLIGIVRSKQIALIASFVFVCVFLVVSYRSYYAVLFLPLLVGGILSYPKVLRHAAFVLAAQIVISVWIFAQSTLAFSPSAAHTVMQKINAVPSSDIVLIHGIFGHEWQYESRSPIFRYRPALVSKAKAVICFEECLQLGNDFYLLENSVQEVWVRR